MINNPTRARVGRAQSQPYSRFASLIAALCVSDKNVMLKAARYDYLLLLTRSGTGATLAKESAYVETFQQPQSSPFTNLSDHFGISSTLTITSNSKRNII